MKRKIIVIVSAIIFGIVISYIIYTKTSPKKTVGKIDVIVIENNEIETKDDGGDEILEPPIEDNNIDIKDDEVVIESNEKNNSPKKNNQTNNNVKQNQIKEDNNVSSNVDNSSTVEKQEEPINQPGIINEPPKEEVKEDIVIPTTPQEPEYDEEYYRLKSKTFETTRECWDKGIEISLTDTVNINGTYCESVGYKGELIGYKLFIIYKTGEITEYKW